MGWGVGVCDITTTLLPGTTVEESVGDVITMSRGGEGLLELLEECVGFTIAFLPEAAVFVNVTVNTVTRREELGNVKVDPCG